MIEDINIRVLPHEAASDKAIVNAVSKAIHIETECVNQWKIIRRSIDARQRQVIVNLTVRVAHGDDKCIPINAQHTLYKSVADSEHHIIIIGAGPAGLFAALKAIELGIRPIILERGNDVDNRRKDLVEISRNGNVNPNSNYCFGEGGAGAYSDGKLFTRSKKRGSVEHILQILHQHGASDDILIEAHAHIGSDKLPHIIKSIRNTIIDNGGEVHFNTCMSELLIEGNKIVGVKTSDNKIFKSKCVVLATGHSARDVYRMLREVGVKIEAKGLAIGVRLEHPQALIDRLQYHSQTGRGDYLPAAEYNYVAQVDGRGVYSFCMCPGGVIVPSASDENQSAVNGMSASARASEWANSGMVVEVRPGDFPEFSCYKEYEMLELQEMLEKDFYDAAGQSMKAPAQRMLDFVNKKVSSSLPKSSYAPGLLSLPVHFLLPKEIACRLQEGFRIFGKRSKGFLTNEATVIGLESRTSSPIRVPRDKETLCHIEIEGLYPAGEGAGYAGGIVSAAIDGERCVEAFYKTIENQK